VTEKMPETPSHNYAVINRYNGYTHVRCRLETGRTHQIRVHMAYIGHPVLGDLVYGRKKPEKGAFRPVPARQRTKIYPPEAGELIELKTELPPYFTEVPGADWAISHKVRLKGGLF
jgi:23S rRNA pseudouridine1911/1915/1917 synthase